MITHAIVELKQPVKEEYFHMDTVLPSEYYGYGTPLVLCKDCKWWNADTCMEWYDTPYTPSDGFCYKGERKEK